MEVLLFLVLIFGCTAVSVAVPLGIIALIGLHVRRNLAREIAEREQRVAHLLVTNLPELGPGRQVTLVVGSMVYAADAPARHALGWRGLVGGQAESMRARMESARRMATIRALEQASQLGAGAVLNLRYATSQLQSQNRSSRGRPLIELIAYGTAWVPAGAAGAAGAAGVAGPA